MNGALKLLAIFPHPDDGHRADHYNSGNFACLVENRSPVDGDLGLARTRSHEQRAGLSVFAVQRQQLLEGRYLVMVRFCFKLVLHGRGPPLFLRPMWFTRFLWSLGTRRRHQTMKSISG